MNSNLAGSLHSACFIILCLYEIFVNSSTAGSLPSVWTKYFLISTWLFYCRLFVRNVYKFQHRWFITITQYEMFMHSNTAVSFHSVFTICKFMNSSTAVSFPSVCTKCLWIPALLFCYALFVWNTYEFQHCCFITLCLCEMFVNSNSADSVPFVCAKCFLNSSSTVS